MGKRISIQATRALLGAALAGELHAPDREYEVHPVFDLKMPRRCKGVAPAILDPRAQWKDATAYDAAALELRDMFRSTFEAKWFAELGIEPVM